jgi:hypothetical protein
MHHRASAQNKNRLNDRPGANRGAGHLLARPLAQLRLVDLTPRRLADYRDERLSRVRPASVLRELALPKLPL